MFPKEIYVPAHVIRSYVRKKDKTVPLNLNKLHTLHFREFHKVREAFKDSISAVITDYAEPNQRIAIWYSVYLKCKKGDENTPQQEFHDINNVAYAVGKFFEDVIQPEIIPNDTHQNLPMTVITFGGYAPETHIKATIASVDDIDKDTLNGLVSRFFGSLNKGDFNETP